MREALGYVPPSSQPPAAAAPVAPEAPFKPGAPPAKRFAFGFKVQQQVRPGPAHDTRTAARCTHAGACTAQPRAPPHAHTLRSRRRRTPRSRASWPWTRQRTASWRAGWVACLGRGRPCGPIAPAAALLEWLVTMLSLLVPRAQVWLCGMPHEYSEEDVRAYWEYCGPIESMDLLKFKDSGRFNGAAFVTFATEVRGSVGISAGCVIIMIIKNGNTLGRACAPAGRPCAAHRACGGGSLTHAALRPWCCPPHPQEGYAAALACNGEVLEGRTLKVGCGRRRGSLQCLGAQQAVPPAQACHMPRHVRACACAGGQVQDHRAARAAAGHEH